MLEEEWRARAESHQHRVAPWIAGRLARRPRGEKNAVEDFLFDYYPYSPSKLVTWHPGYGVTLEGAGATAYLSYAGYCRVDAGVAADLAWLVPRRDRLSLALRILAGTASRPASTGCFGLHEWAMVYGQGQDEVRHSYLPLRLSREEIADVVDEVGLRCTHIDAFRFFTADAAPLNLHQPTRATQPDLEQPGCLHASMDLYKYAFWFSPLVPSELIADCFENAVRARELDMRASPYDMEPFGLEPIRVETPEGRREYAREQQLMMVRTSPVRARLLVSLTGLRDALAPVMPTASAG